VGTLVFGQHIFRVFAIAHLRRSLISLVISDDISTHSFRTRLVSVAALLRRYSPSPHPLLRLLGHIPALLPVTNHDLLTMLFCRANFVNLHNLCSGRPSWLPGTPNRILLKMRPSISEGDFLEPVPWDPVQLPLTLTVPSEAIQYLEYYNCEYVYLKDCTAK
jgi:hypothetical protein